MDYSEFDFFSVYRKVSGSCQALYFLNFCKDISGYNFKTLNPAVVLVSLALIHSVKPCTPNAELGPIPRSRPFRSAVQN